MPTTDAPNVLIVGVTAHLHNEWPKGWESYVKLEDGGVAHIEGPVGPDDLMDFWVQDGDGGQWYTDVAVPVWQPKNTGQFAEWACQVVAMATGGAYTKRKDRYAVNPYLVRGRALVGRQRSTRAGDTWDMPV